MNIVLSSETRKEAIFAEFSRSYDVDILLKVIHEPLQEEISGLFILQGIQRSTKLFDPDKQFQGIRWLNHTETEAVMNFLQLIARRRLKHYQRNNRRIGPNDHKFQLAGKTLYVPYSLIDSETHQLWRLSNLISIFEHSMEMESPICLFIDLEPICKLCEDILDIYFYASSLDISGQIATLQSEHGTNENEINTAISQLAERGYLTSTNNGSQNEYKLNPQQWCRSTPPSRPGGH